MTDSAVVDGRSTSKHDRKPKPLGTIVVRSRGRYYKTRFIKVAMHGVPGERWKLYARWWWEKNRGPVPRGKRVIHLDGNPLNDDPGNLALGTASDVAAIWHFNNPEGSDANYRKVRQATIECNRVRGALNRLQHWLPTRWYPVDYEGRRILNQPRRQRWQVYELAGVDVNIVGWRRIRSAALGWPQLPLLQACICAALAKSQMLLSIDLIRQTAQLRELHGWRGFTKGAYYSAISNLQAVGYVRGRRRGIAPGYVHITSKAMDERAVVASLVPVRGQTILIDPQYATFEKVCDELQGRSRGDRLRELVGAIALREEVA